jgi:hypothetical protein
MEGMPPVLVRDGVRRDGFLATLGARTWRSRASSAAALADLDAVSSAAAYVAWLGRTASAWERLPVPPNDPQAWPLVTVGPECLGGHEELAADLASLGARTPGARAGREVLDEAFLVGAAAVADAALLAAAAAELAQRDEMPVGTTFLHRCREVGAAQGGLRRELAAWAADRDRGTGERAVLAARTLSLELAEALRG